MTSRGTSSSSDGGRRGSRRRRRRGGGGGGGGWGGGLGGCLLSVFIDTDELLAALLGGCGCCLELFFVLPDFFLLCLLDFGLLSVVSGGVWNSVVTLCI